MRPLRALLLVAALAAAEEPTDVRRARELLAQAELGEEQAAELAGTLSLLPPALSDEILGRHGALEPLRPATVAALRSERTKLAAAAASVLSGAGPPQTADEIDAARALVGASDRELRLAAVRLCIAWDDNEIVEPLLGWLAGEDRDLRTEATMALRRLLPIGPSGDPQGWAAWYVSDRERAEALIAERTPALARQPDAAFFDALRDIGRLRNHRRLAAERIAPLLRHQDPLVVAAAYRCLLELKGPEATLAMAEVPRPPEVAELAAPPTLVAGTQSPAQPEAAMQARNGRGGGVLLAALVAAVAAAVVLALRRGRAAAAPVAAATPEAPVPSNRKIKKVTFAD